MSREEFEDGSHLLGGGEVKLPGAQETQLEVEDGVSFTSSP